MQRVAEADHRPEAEVLVLHDDDWWSARATRIDRGWVTVAIHVRGSVVRRRVLESAVAVRLDPERYTPPAPGSKVLAAQRYMLADGSDPVAMSGRLGWRPARVLAFRDGEVEVKFDPDEDDGSTVQKWVPLSAIACFLADEVAGSRTRPRAPPRWSQADLWLLAPLLLAAFGWHLWRIGHVGLGASWISTLLAIAVYQHRSMHPLSRFHRIKPRLEAPQAPPGVSDRNNDSGLVYVYTALLFAGGTIFVVLAFVAINTPRVAVWLGLVAAAAWVSVLALVLARRELPQMRVLATLWRAGPHRDPGTWGVSAGVVAAAEPFTRCIDIHEWTSLQTFTETVTRADGGTEQEHSEVTHFHSVGCRVEQVPDALELRTPHGPITIRGSRQAVWGTAHPTVESFMKRARTCERIVERIEPGDPIVVYGKLEEEAGARSIDHTGPGSLMIFGAAPGEDPLAAVRARLTGHVLSLVLFVAALIPALLAARMSG